MSVKDVRPTESHDLASSRGARRQARQGQALTEVAVLGLSAVVLLLGIVDLGRAFYQAMAIREATQAGALVALNWQAVTAQCGTVKPCATQQVLNAIKATPSGITINESDIVLGPDYNAVWIDTTTAWQPGQAFTITVNHTFHFITPFLTNAKFLNLGTTISANRNP